MSPRSYGHGIGVGDINADGRNDIVTPLGWPEAPPDPRSGDWKFHPEFDLVSVGYIYVLDVNGDGRPDLVTSMAHDYGIFWMENLGGGDLPGEYYSPTQPFRVKPPPLSRLSFTMDDIARITPEHENACCELLEKSGRPKPRRVHARHGRRRWSQLLKREKLSHRGRHRIRLRRCHGPDERNQEVLRFWQERARVTYLD